MVYTGDVAGGGVTELVLPTLHGVPWTSRRLWGSALQWSSVVSSNDWCPHVAPNRLSLAGRSLVPREMMILHH